MPPRWSRSLVLTLALALALVELPTSAKYDSLAGRACGCVRTSATRSPEHKAGQTSSSRKLLPQEDVIKARVVSGNTGGAVGR